MIISASYKTDIPAFYGDWFMQRLKEGVAEVRNPWGGQRHQVSLQMQDVSGFVFWTRNLRPFLERLWEVSAVKPCIVQYTVTGYPRALETSTVAPDHAAADMRLVARRLGPAAAVWRYDPILISSLTPADWHAENFAGVAAMLAGTTDEVVVSFAHVYRKTRRNLDAAAARHGFAWDDPEEAEKRALVVRLAAIAARHGMRLTICAQASLVVPGTALAQCIDSERLARVVGRPVPARRKGNRPDCLCAESRDIGAYDTCPHGCVYCYAVASPALAKRRYAAHDPAAAMLSGDATKNENTTAGANRHAR